MYEIHNLSIRTKISLGGTTRNHFAKNHTNKVGPNLENKISSTYTLVYLIGLGGLCFPHLCTHS
jgi:hypothetical protein